MLFNRHSGVHLVCIQMSIQIIAIANEPPSAILLILLTRGVNCCCTKAIRDLGWRPKFNNLEKIINSAWQWQRS